MLLLAIACTQSESPFLAPPTSKPNGANESSANVTATPKPQPTEGQCAKQEIDPWEPKSAPFRPVDFGGTELPSGTGSVMPEFWPYAYFGLTTLEERVLYSDVILHAELKSVTAAGSFRGHTHGWLPLIQYEFEAIDYVKGMGAGLVYVNVTFTGDYAANRHATFYYANERDAIEIASHEFFDDERRWDDKEALIFLNRYEAKIPQCDSDRIKYGEVYGFALSEYYPEFELSSRYNRAWLPVVESESLLTPIEFHLSEPNHDEDYQEARTISLDAMRIMVNEFTDLKNKPTNVAHGEYIDCLKAKYARLRENQATIETGGYALNVHVPRKPVKRILFDRVEAGRDLGMGWLALRYSDDTESNRRTIFSLVGNDSHLFDIGVTIPYRYRQNESYDLHIFPVEDLPIGVYRFQFTVQEPEFQLCDFNDPYSVQPWTIIVMERNEIPSTFLSRTGGYDDIEFDTIDFCIIRDLGIIDLRAPENHQDRDVFWQDWPYRDSVVMKHGCPLANRTEKIGMYFAMNIMQMSQMTIDALNESCGTVNLFTMFGYPPNLQLSNIRRGNVSGVGDMTQQDDLYSEVLTAGQYTFGILMESSSDCDGVRFRLGRYSE